MDNVKDIYINSINELHKGAIAIYDEIFTNITNLCEVSFFP